MRRDLLPGWAQGTEELQSVRTSPASATAAGGGWTRLACRGCAWATAGRRPLPRCPRAGSAVPAAAEFDTPSREPRRKTRTPSIRTPSIPHGRVLGGRAGSRDGAILRGRPGAYSVPDAAERRQLGVKSMAAGALPAPRGDGRRKNHLVHHGALGNVRVDEGHAQVAQAHRRLHVSLRNRV